MGINAKIRLDENELAELKKRPDGVKYLLFLLTDADRFIRQLKTEFPACKVFKADLEPKLVQNLVFPTVVVCPNEVPGPLAFGNVNWDDFEKMVLWSSVCQVEKIQTYSAAKEE
jgi:hypothetical protein